MEPKAWVWVAEHCRMARRKCGSRTKSIRLIIWILLFGLWIKKRGTKEKYPNWSRLICRVSIIGSEYPVMDALLLCEKWWKAEAVDAHPVSVKAEMRKGTGNFLPPFSWQKKQQIFSDLLLAWRDGRRVYSAVTAKAELQQIFYRPLNDVFLHCVDLSVYSGTRSDIFGIIEGLGCSGLRDTLVRFSCRFLMFRCLCCVVHYVLRLIFQSSESSTPKASATNPFAASTLYNRLAGRQLL